MIGLQWIGNSRVDDGPGTFFCGGTEGVPTREMTKIYDILLGYQMMLNLAKRKYDKKKRVGKEQIIGK